MKKVRLDIQDLAVSSFETTVRDEEPQGTVFANSTAQCESDSGCPTALCTRDMYYPECRIPTYYNCTPACGDDPVYP